MTPVVVHVGDRGSPGVPGGMWESGDGQVHVVVYLSDVAQRLHDIRVGDSVREHGPRLAGRLVASALDALARRGGT